MDIKDTLAKLDTVLGIKPMKLVTMTKAQFDEHVTSELTKAKADAEEGDTEKKTKAKKRIEHLRAVVKLLVTKASWDGGNGEAAIPVYEEGYEPPTYLPTEEGGNMTGGSGTQGEGESFAAGGGASGYNDAMSANGGSSGTNVPASGSGTQTSGASYAAGGGAQSFAKSLDNLTAVIKSITAPEPAPAAKAAPAVTGHVDDPSVWPADLANESFMKEGIAKRAEEWGGDPWAAVK